MTRWRSALGDAAVHLGRRKGTVQQAEEYCTKLDSRLWGPYEYGKSSAVRDGSKKRNSNEAFGEALAAASKEDAANILQCKEPAAWCRSFGQINAALDAKFAKAAPVYTTPAYYTGAWNVPFAAQLWVDEYLHKEGRKNMLVLVGATKLGKTAWARSLGRHMFWRGHTDVRHWDDEALYMVLDDIDWKKLSSEERKALCLSAGDCVLTDRYLSKKPVFNNKACIWCTNEWDEESSYWAENTTVVRCSGKLFVD